MFSELANCLFSSENIGQLVTLLSIKLGHWKTFLTLGFKSYNPYLKLVKSIQILLLLRFYTGYNFFLCTLISVGGTWFLNKILQWHQYRLNTFFWAWLYSVNVHSSGNETLVLYLLILLLQLENLIQFSKTNIGLFIKSLFMKIEAGKLLGHEEKG